MRPKRYCVAENREFTAVRTTELDALEAQVARLVEALRETLPAVDRDLAKRIAELLREYKETLDE